MAKTSDHRHQPAHGGLISAGFGLLAAMWWLPSPRGLWNPNQVHPILGMDPYRRPTARSVNIRPLVGLLRGPTSTSGWSDDGAPYHRPNAAHMMTYTCPRLAIIDAWFDPIMIDNMTAYQPRRGRRSSVPRALSYQMDCVAKRWTLTRQMHCNNNKIDMLMTHKRITSLSHWYINAIISLWYCKTIVT